VYGAGNVTHDKYDETGYLALPPCLWGADKGLQPSVFLPKVRPATGALCRGKLSSEGKLELALG
jgi:hypothetical protein